MGKNDTKLCSVFTVLIVL